MSTLGPEDVVLRQQILAQASRAGRAAENAARVTRARFRRVAMALLAAGSVFAIWYLFVLTRVGQILDSVAMLASHRFSWLFGGIDRSVLASVSVNALVAIIVFAALIAIIRRRWMLGLRAVILIAGATLTTQGLKHFLLSRPLLIPSEQIINSLPSGHTTAAAAAGAALVMVMPLTWRSIAAIAATVLTALMGISTIINHWHRPSDVVAAILIVAVWALLLAPIERGRKRHSRVAPTLVGIGLLLIILAAASLSLAAWMLTDSLEAGLVIQSQAGLNALAASGNSIGSLCAVGAITASIGFSAYMFGQLDRLAFK